MVPVRTRTPRKQCKGCTTLKAVTSFYGPYGRTETAKGWFTARCKPCHVAYVGEKRKSRRERIRAALQPMIPASMLGMICEEIPDNQVHIHLT